MAIRIIFALFACVLFLWVHSDIQTGIAMPMNRHAKGSATWDDDALEFGLAVVIRGVMALGFTWLALFHDFGKENNSKKDRIEKRKSRLQKKHLDK
jgi:hypothetical protein